MKKFAFALLCGFVVSVFAAPAFAADAAGDKKKPDLEAQFKKMDKNSDGKLTETEFCGKRKDDKLAKAKEQFAKLDKDSDKLLSLEEFKTRGKKKAKA